MDPFISYAIMAVTVLVSLLCFRNQAWFDRWKHSPFREHNFQEYARLITSGFLHGSWVHLGVNLFVFYSFGRFTELAITGYYPPFEAYAFDGYTGHFVFLLLYIFTIGLANIHTFLNKADDVNYAAIGASGAVSGTVFCFVLFLPWEIIELYFFIKIPAILVGVGFLIYSQYAARRNNDNIDHAAHFWGALAMPAMLLLLKPGLALHFWNQLINNAPF